MIRRVFRALQNFFRRPGLRFGLRTDRRGRFRDPRFVSFLVQNNRRTLDTGFQDAVLRGRKFTRRVLVALAALSGAWVVLESARALAVF